MPQCPAPSLSVGVQTGVTVAGGEEEVHLVIHSVGGVRGVARLTLRGHSSLHRGHWVGVTSSDVLSGG